jgi:hypothetical protein
MGNLDLAKTVTEIRGERILGGHELGGPALPITLSDCG